MSFLTSFRKKRTKKTTRQRPVKFDWKKWAFRGLIAFFIVWIVLIALAADVPKRTQDWITHQFHTLSAQSGFQLKQIAVTGRENTDATKLRKLIHVEQGQSIFALDLDRLHKDILMLPWVKSAALRRAWPDRLNIHLTEHTATAIWQYDGQAYLLDENADIIHSPLREEFSKLPVMIGKDAPAHTKKLLELIDAEPLVKSEFDSAKRLGDRRWDVVLKNGIILKLPEDDMEFALARIADAQKKYLIFSKEILSLDARFSDRLIVKASSGAASRLSDMLASNPSNDTVSVSP